MADPSMVIRIAANVAELKKNLAEGRIQIETTTAAMSKIAAGFQGDKLKQQAMNVTAAVANIGGASKLTEAEQARVNVTLTKALEKYRALGQEAPAAMVALANATKRVDTESAGVSARLVAIGAAAGTFLGNVAYDAARRLAGSLVDIAGNGVKLAPTVGAFEALTRAVGQSDTAMLTAARNSTKGLLPNLDLMQAANKGLLLGLPITAQSFGQLAQTAVVLGKAMGQGPVQSFDDLMTALGRSSPMILDNLGLSVQVGDANAKYAASVGKVASELTAAEQKQAFYNAAMTAAQLKVASLGGVQLTLADRYQQARVTVQNLTDALGVAIAQSPVVNAGFAAAADVVTRAFGANQTQQVAAFMRVVNTTALTFVDLASAGNSSAKLIAESFYLSRGVVFGFMEAVTNVVYTVAKMNAKVAEAAAFIPGVGGQYALMAQAARAASDGVGSLAASFKRTKDEAFDSMGTTRASFEASGAAIAEVRAHMASASDASTVAAAAAEALGARQRALADSSAQVTLATKAEIAEATKRAEQMAYVTTLSQGYQAVVDTIDGSVVEAIKYYREQGIQLGVLGEVYGLTAAQVEGLGQSEAAEQQMLAALTSGTQALTKAMLERKRVSVEVLEASTRSAPSIGTLQSGANPQLEQIRNSVSYQAMVFARNAGAMLETELPKNIMAAITGGGSIYAAAGSTLGSFLTSEEGLGNQMKKGLSKILGSSLGAAAGAMLPGLGALAGPLLEKLFGGPSQQEMEGRKAAANFEKGIAAGLNAQQIAEAGGRSWAMTVIGVRDAYLAVGRSAAEAEAAVAAMWAAEQQGSEAVAAVQAGMQGVIDQAAKLRQSASAFGPSQTELRQMATDAKATYDYMLQAGVYTAEQLASAFTASQEAQARSLGINTAVQQKSMDMLKTALTDLTQKRDALWQQIAAEAPEDVMGVVEAGARAQLATMDAMIAAQQAEQTRQADAYAAEVEAALASIQDRIQPIIVPIVYDPQPFPGGSVGLDPIPMANGGFGEVTGPTLFLAGEKGRREQVAFSGADQTFANRGFPGAGGGDVTRLQQTMDGIRSDLARMPQMMGLAVRDAVVGQRGGRR